MRPKETDPAKQTPEESKADAEYQAKNEQIKQKLMNKFKKPPQNK